MELRRQLMAGRQSGNIYYRNYLTVDGAIAVGNLSASLRQKMRDSLQIEYDPRDHDPWYNPRDPKSVEFGQQLTERVEAMICERSTDYWVDHFGRAGVPVSPIMFIEELAQHPQVVENEYIVELEHEMSGKQWTVAPPHKMSVSPPTVGASSPPLGRDTDRILAAASYSVEEIQDLRATKAIA